MKYKNTIILCVIIFIIIVLGIIALARFSSKVFSVDPTLHDNEKWKIAYYEGGSFIDYKLSILGTVKGLMEFGWIEPMNIPDFQNEYDMKVVWNYLARNVESKYIAFLEDAFWSASWDDSIRIRVRKDAIDQFNKGDIDFVIAAGTWAGQDLVNDEHETPTMVISSSDPIKAGIIDRADDSGYDHILVECDPDRYRKQIELFHDIIGFERLGVIFEDSEDGRIYANYNDLEKVSKKRNFKLIVCHAQEGNSEEESFDNAKKSYHILAPIVDAMWVGLHQGESVKFMSKLLQSMFEFKVPTWCVLGEPAVEKGVLLSITHQDFNEMGLWYAQNIAKIFNGAVPQKLPQTFENKNHILINSETARRIGYRIPGSLLEIADKIYDDIK